MVKSSSGSGLTGGRLSKASLAPVIYRVLLTLGLFAAASFAANAGTAGGTPGTTLVIDTIDVGDNLIAELNNALLAPLGGISILPKSEIFVGRIGGGKGGVAQSATYVGFNLVSALADPTPNLLLPNGILLTSGNANISNTNTSEDFQGVANTGGDLRAEQILADAGRDLITADVNSYSFEFTVADGVDAISARFVFGSEEFPNPNFTETDFFLFIVNGENFATFEDGTLVLFDAGQNDENFNDNDFNNPTANYPIEYDGLSNVLTVVAPLQPQKSGTHSLKIIVGDSSDGEAPDPNLDSAVFIGGLRGCELGVDCESGPPIRDASDPVCVSLTLDGSQAFGFATDNGPSEDSNGNGFLDPGEDTNQNGLIDLDTGISAVDLTGKFFNLEVNLAPGFEPGDPTVNYSVDLIDPNSPGVGGIRVTDGFGNTCSQFIEVPALCEAEVACDTGLEGVCGDGLTACDEAGTETCVGEIQPGDIEEFCDGSDNDCDGAIDEEQDQLTACGSGLCAATGEILCIDGELQPDTCQAAEGIVAATSCGVGECGATGVIECVKGSELPDTCQPIEGVIEETSCGVGQCGSAGVIECVQGVAQADTCQPIEGVIEETSCGVGECVSAGVIECVQGVAQADTCQPIEGVIEETSCGGGACVATGVIECADGVAQPDTCQPLDGEIAQTTCGAGECAAEGVIVCLQGEEQPDTCLPIEGVLEFTSCGIGQCASTGVIACADGVLQMDTCMEGETSAEVCDGIDNNCNASVDEGVCILPVCSDLELVDGSELEYMGTATDELGITVIEAAVESNLNVTPGFKPGQMTAEFRVGIGELDLPSGGIVSATDTEGLMCSFPPVDFPMARGVGFTPTWAEGVVLEGGLGYVLDERDGLSIFDLTNLETSGQQLIGSLRLNAEQCPNGVFHEDLEVQGSIVVIADRFCGLIFVDAFDPTNPFVITTFDTLGEAEDVMIGQDGRVYVADFVRGLVVVDASQPSEPFEIAVVETSGDPPSSPAAGTSLFGGESSSLTGSPIALFLDEQRGLLYLGTTRGLFIIDIDEKGNYPVIGAFESNPNDGTLEPERTARSPQDVVAAGDVAYLSIRERGLLIFDVSNPSNPRPIGDPIETVQIFYKLSISESRLFIGEGSCGVAVFQIVGTELREVLGSPFPLDGSAVDCLVRDETDTFAWSIDDLDGRVLVGTGIIEMPTTGGFQFLDFTETLAMPIPEPESRLMLVAAIATLVALRGRRNPASRKKSN